MKAAQLGVGFFCAFLAVAIVLAATETAMFFLGGSCGRTG